jgi:polyhydroxyalkanoate synthesis repressor PhaR
MAITVKKYSNRRLYDTAESRYVTLDELAAKIRGGADARVIDAQNGQNLTQVTLAQIILESRGAARLLPVSFLVQLIRMRDDALAEFMGRWMTWALAVYQRARQGAETISAYNPFAMAPFAATNALARMLAGGGPTDPPAPWNDAPPPPPVEAPPSQAREDDVAALRRELEDLKKSLRPKKRR